jgi:hypothetical protein
MGGGGRKEKVVPLLNKPGLTQHFLLASQQDVLLRKANKPQLWMAAILGTWKQAVSRKAWIMDIVHKVASQVLNVETQCNRLVTPGNVRPNSKVPYSTQSSGPRLTEKQGKRLYGVDGRATVPLAAFVSRPTSHFLGESSGAFE